ncbi:hypothetical protein DSO57_1017133 [Entomophthora muscae]|uniref:Uncharacterized protein n=1 Tax=Entomophthora muscae TaxID=34485 RepID=A0ACC2RJD8_9FUNG|nr:hypothetical protein DSO57_1017133 [Entomophthora muscae]
MNGASVLLGARANSSSFSSPQYLKKSWCRVILQVWYTATPLSHNSPLKEKAQMYQAPTKVDTPTVRWLPDSTQLQSSIILEVYFQVGGCLTGTLTQLDFGFDLGYTLVASREQVHHNSYTSVEAIGPLREVAWVM